MDIQGHNVTRIAEYIRSGEKAPDRCSVGVEFEHILIEKDTLKSVVYTDEKGTQALFVGLLQKGWQPIEENGRILGVHKDGDMITLEPGAQLEISVRHTQSIGEIESRYQQFLGDVGPLLEQNGQRLLALGYHPVNTISQIPLIPKKRYEYMSQYLGAKDTHGLNMMKGTASAQVVIDYTSEEDFIRKFRTANSFTVALAYLFDNTPIFEGAVWENNMARTHVWNHVDEDRSGIFQGVFETEFGYREYASYVWNKPLVISLLDGQFAFTKDLPMREVYKDRLLRTEEIEHALSMFFPDVRAKKYIEIRMCDSVPHPFNVALAALVKGIFYDEENLNYFYETSLGMTRDGVQELKNRLVSEPDVPQEVRALAQELLERAEKGLPPGERMYLAPLHQLFMTHGNLSAKIKKDIKEGKESPFGPAFAT